MPSIDQLFKLSAHWIGHIKRQGETGMGYYIVTVTLKDGRRFDQAVVMLPYLGGIRGLNDIPFREEDIQDMHVTHHKWDWSKEPWNQP
jgi:hypothetical protein